MVASSIQAVTPCPSTDATAANRRLGETNLNLRERSPNTLELLCTGSLWSAVATVTMREDPVASSTRHASCMVNVEGLTA